MSHVQTSQVRGVHAEAVTVHCARTQSPLPHLEIALSADAERETRVRVRAACAASNLARWGSGATVSFSSGSLVTSGAALDLPIALALVGEPLDERTAVVGELALTGRVRPVRGIVAHVQCAIDHGRETILIPGEQGEETAHLADQIKIRACFTLTEAVAFANGYEAACVLVKHRPLVEDRPGVRIVTDSVGGPPVSASAATSGIYPVRCLTTDATLIQSAHERDGRSGVRAGVDFSGE